MYRLFNLLNVGVDPLEREEERRRPVMGVTPGRVAGGEAVDGVAGGGEEADPVDNEPAMCSVDAVKEAVFSGDLDAFPEPVAVA